MTEDSRKADDSGGEAAARVRTAGETPAAGRRPGQRPVRPGSPARRPPRPRPSGAGARVLVPVALVICAVAVFSVLTSGGSSDTGSRSATKSSDSGKRGKSSGGGSKSTSRSGGAAKPLRATYRIKPGDTFSAIAVKTGVDVDRLAELNPDVDPRALQTGKKLKLK